MAHWLFVGSFECGLKKNKQSEVHNKIYVFGNVCLQPNLNVRDKALRPTTILKPSD